MRLPTFDPTAAFSATRSTVADTLGASFTSVTVIATVHRPVRPVASVPSTRSWYACRFSKSRTSAATLISPSAWLILKAPCAFPPAMLYVMRLSMLGSVCVIWAPATTTVFDALCSAIVPAAQVRVGASGRSATTTVTSAVDLPAAVVAATTSV